MARKMPRRLVALSSSAIAAIYFAGFAATRAADAGIASTASTAPTPAAADGTAGFGCGIEDGGFIQSGIFHPLSWENLGELGSGMQYCNLSGLFFIFFVLKRKIAVRQDWGQASNSCDSWDDIVL